MDKVSVIIPSRNEVFLTKTINDLINKATGEVEVIAVLDGYWPEPLGLEQLPEHKNLIIIHRGKPMGMRAAINAAASVASGKYLMKVDAHCMFKEGYDEVLKADCEENWIVVPSRYSLDAENWAIENNGKPRRDYHYLCYPDPNKGHDKGMHGVEWWSRGKERLDPVYDIDETMSMQGSCWFMYKSWFTDFLKGMNEEGYGTFSQEPQEIGMKTWLGGGKIMTNKKTYYCHLHKGSRYGRMYPQSREDKNAIVYAHNWSADFWMNNRWENRIHDMEWFIDRFWPVPTWPENWKEIDYTRLYL
jgi:glycosyltransferase involved in cell wall biosynthesis